MKLGIIGSHNIIESVVKVIIDEIPDIEYITVYADILAETPAKAMQLEKEVDAILFTGPYNYYYTLKYLPKPNIPWSFLPHNRVSALQALLQATITLHNNLENISLDSYDENIIREALYTVGIRNANIYNTKLDLEAKDVHEKPFLFHSQNYAQNKNVVCLTSFAYCYELLTKANIPCIRILPAREIIREQIYYLKLQHLADSEQQGNCAAIAIHYNYIFDNEKDFSLREWEKLRYQNEIREYVYSIAQKLHAAVYSDDIVPFFIVTTKNMLNDVFLKQQEHIKLLQFGQQLQQFRVCIGIGLGNSSLEAKSRSTMALNHAFRDIDARAYIAHSDTEIIVPAVTKEPTAATTLELLAKQCGLTVHTLEKLKDTLSKVGNPTTAEALAKAMQVNIRSVNRILTKLEDIGCINIVAKDYNGKGRPARVMKIII